MTWPLFAVIQLTMMTIGLSAAFLLRNRSLKARYAELQEALEASETAVAEAMTRVTDGAEKVWLRDRLGQLSDDSDVARVQQLVLANELEADGDFENKLTTILSSAEAAVSALAQRWATARESATNLASGLIERYPLSHPVIAQLHEAYRNFDEELGTTAADLPDAPEVSVEDATDLTQESEHLRATNDLLQQENDKLRGQLNQQSLDGADADEQAEDLKALLQQFTKDSRDMMACIQKLEAENANLRQQLGLSADDSGEHDTPPPPTDSMSSDERENPPGPDPVH